MKGWKWSWTSTLMGSWLGVLTFVAWIEQAYLPMPLGLILGVAFAALFLVQMLRERQVGMAILAALGAFIMAHGDRTHAHRLPWLDHGMSIALAASGIGRAVQSFIERRRTAGSAAAH